MTYGQAFIALCVVATASAAVMVMAQARAGTRGLAAAAAALMLVTTGLLASRIDWSTTLKAHDFGGILAAVVAIVIAALVVHVRGSRRSKSLTAALSWVVLMFVFFETAYLLRPK